MKVRPDKFRGFILTAETSYEKDILDCFGGQWFTSRHGVGADMLFRVTNKDAPLEVWKDGESVEVSSNSLQQLRAEICLGVGSIARDSSIPAVDRLDRIVMFVNEKLSAV